jgi:hypothetical protein
MRPCAILVCSLVCAAALARTPDGMLGVLQTPNDARPAITVRGGSLELTADRPGAVYLVLGSTRVPLEVHWRERPDKTVEANVQVPSNTMPGMYAIEWSDDSVADVSQRAVFVRESMPEAYTFATIHAADENFHAELSEIDSAQHQFCFVVINGGREQVQSALAVASSCATPTYFVYDAPDQEGSDWIGPATHAFGCGPDAFLVLSSGPFGLGDCIGNAPGEFMLLRRKYKTARWAVAVLPAAETAASMRNTLTLFVDDPVHAVIALTPSTVPPTPIDWAGWYEPIPLYAPRDAGMQRYSASLRKVSFSAKPPAVAPR